MSRDYAGIMENVMITLRWAAAVHPIAIGLNQIYPDDQQAVAADAVCRPSRASDTEWFIARTVIYFFLWSLWPGRFYHSRGSRTLRGQ